ncbi:MAG: hypothetical protein RL330_1373 [Actinomycetota bacterium]|jgi:hypothetical protein
MTGYADITFSELVARMALLADRLESSSPGMKSKHQLREIDAVLALVRENRITQADIFSTQDKMLFTRSLERLRAFKGQRHIKSVKKRDQHGSDEIARQRLDRRLAERRGEVAPPPPPPPEPTPAERKQALLDERARKEQLLREFRRGRR